MLSSPLFLSSFFIASPLLHRRETLGTEVGTASGSILTFEIASIEMGLKTRSMTRDNLDGTMLRPASIALPPVVGTLLAIASRCQV